jgi:hypothetical protein
MLEQRLLVFRTGCMSGRGFHTMLLKYWRCRECPSLNRCQVLECTIEAAQAFGETFAAHFTSLHPRKA